MLLRPYADTDRWLLDAVNTPEMTAYLGGPDSLERVEDRHARYVAMPPSVGVVRVVVADDGGIAGSVVYWTHEWRGADVYEIGWAILPAYQRQGLATAAVTALLDVARAEGRNRYVHAFPSVANAASNGVCRRAGFVLQGEVDVEYPPGQPLRANDWRYDLRAGA